MHLLPLLLLDSFSLFLVFDFTTLVNLTSDELLLFDEGKHPVSDVALD